MGAVATTYGMSGPLEQARLAMDVVQNILLPFESAIYTAATSYLMAFAIIILLGYTLLRLATAADGEGAMKGFGVFILVCFLTLPVSVNFDNPFLWHDFGNELTSPTSTYQNGGANTCRGLVDDQDSSGTAPAVPSCGSYKVAFGTLAYFTVANLVEDLLYDAANYGVKQMGGGVDDVPAGAYEALSIPPDGLSGNPDTNKLYRSYVDSCTPVAVQDQHSTAPLDPRAWYTLGLLGGGGLGVDLLYLSPGEFTVAASNAGFTPAGSVLNNPDYIGVAIPAVQGDADKALDEMAGYTPPAVGIGNAINWFHIPTEAYWINVLKTRAQPNTDYQPQGIISPSDQLVPFNPNVAFGSSQVIGANEFASPAVKNYFLSLVGLSTTKAPDPPPSDPNAWYAYNCFDLYALTHIAFSNYYNAERQVLTDANTRAFCSSGCVGDPTVIRAAEVGTEHEMTVEMEALSDQVEQKAGQTSGAGDAIISNIQAGKSWIGNIFSTYFTLPIVVSTAIGAATYGLGFLFFMAPLIFVAALIPGRAASIGLWMKCVAFLKTTIFLMYIFVVVGSLIINWTQINQAAAMWGGHAGTWKYVAATFAGQGLVLSGVVAFAPILAYLLVFMVASKLATHAHHHVNVALTAAGGYIIGKGLTTVVTGGRGVQQARKAAETERKAEDFRRKSEARFEAGQIAQAQRFSELRAETRDSFNKMTESLENRGGTLVRKEVFDKDGGKTVTSTFTVGPRQGGSGGGGGGGNGGPGAPSGNPRRSTDEIFGDVKKLGPEYEEAARTFKPDDEPPSGN